MKTTFMTHEKHDEPLMQLLRQKPGDLIRLRGYSATTDNQIKRIILSVRIILS